MGRTYIGVTVAIHKGETSMKPSNKRTSKTLGRVFEAEQREGRVFIN